MNNFNVIAVQSKLENGEEFQNILKIEKEEIIQNKNSKEICLT